ncbi:MAG: DUF2298 domain-containing protein [Phototrophicaceae bacterium]|jgi:YYY domain-containing protein
MILDWLAREGWIVFSWWLWVTLAGLAALPLTVRLLGSLPDKGVTLARALGMMFVAFVYWTLGVLGFISNSAGNIGLAWLIVVILAWVGYRYLPGEAPRWRDLWGENRATILTAELLFIVMLFGWALFRAYHPSLVATEKPMELAFMSAIQRSESFPPNDPWMSGYSISYYYFGYVMSAMLATLSGINSAVGFNVTIALLFALTGLNTFGVVANLVRAVGRQSAAIPVGLLGVFFVGVMGNLQVPLIEVPYQSGTASAEYLEYWDVQDRYVPESRLLAEDERLNVLGMTVRDPARWEFWWWFRASRVINDRNLPRPIAGELNLQSPPVGANVIDEFPMFSFLLADVHPHVLALPFAVMSVGVALSIVLSLRAPSAAQLAFYGFAMGGMMFLNAWDGPIYIVVLIAAEGLRRLIPNAGRFTRRDWGMLALFALSVVGMAFFFYLPYFVGFRSQASGVIPNLQFPTRFTQIFVMFGAFVLILALYLIHEAWEARRVMHWERGLWLTGGLFALLFSVILVVITATAFSPALQMILSQQVGEFGEAVRLIFAKRLSHSVTALVLFIALWIVVARLLARLKTDQGSYSPSTGFALLLVGCGVGLILVPEFIYLRDNFGVRINTIFKFYYQAWVLLGIASAFGVYRLLTAHISVRLVTGVVLLVVVGLGGLYPILGTYNRTQIESGRATAFEPQPLTLDGGRSLVTENDYNAIQCLAQTVQGDDVVIAEAIGGAYRNQFGRVAVLTGLPIVLGWENHERQWRGETYSLIAGTRRTDVETLYNDLRWDVAREIIQRYSIDYIFYGATERYGTGEQPAFAAAGEDKFRENLTVICPFGDSLFYQVTPQSLERSEQG